LFLGRGVPFDMYGNGTTPLLDWVTPYVGFLALPDANGNITTGAQLFGQETTLSCGLLAENGFLALSQYDTNDDGLVNADDPIFSKLRLWFDLNSDGVAQSTELATMSQAGINYITDGYDNVYAPPPGGGAYVGETGNFNSSRGLPLTCPGGGTCGQYSEGTIADVYFPMSAPPPASPASGVCPNPARCVCAYNGASTSATGMTAAYCNEWCMEWGNGPGTIQN
jgi:hypothetical protein